MIRMTAKSAIFGLALVVIWALAGCSESKPGATAASEPAALAVSKDPSTEPTLVIDGKEWMRCAFGQTWEGNTCAGEPKPFHFDEAQTAVKDLNAKGGAYGKTDWRLPTVRELASLRVCSNGFEVEVDVSDGAPALGEACKDGSKAPTLNDKDFPNVATKAPYWSSSPEVKGNFPAWYVYFDNGVLDYYGRESGSYVRLVRASQ